MTLSGHIAVSGLTLQLSHDPTTVVVANLLLHPLLDAIPHAEWSTFRGPDQRRAMVTITVLDAVLSVGLVILLVKSLPEVSFGLKVVAVVAGLWLDLLDPIARRFIRPLREFHEFCHSWPVWFGSRPIDWSQTATGHTPLWVKLCIQIALVLVSALVLL